MKLDRTAVLALVIAIVIAAGAFEPFYVRIFTLDRARLGARFTELPYSKLPGLRELLLGVRERTRPGDSIALVAGADLHRAPAREGGYDYFYNRAPYVLSGRHVVPLLDPNDRFHPEALRQVDYLAAYRVRPALPGFTVVWEGRDGLLLRRAR